MRRWTEVGWWLPIIFALFLQLLRLKKFRVQWFNKNCLLWKKAKVTGYRSSPHELSPDHHSWGNVYMPGHTSLSATELYFLLHPPCNAPIVTAQICLTFLPQCRYFHINTVCISQREESIGLTVRQKEGRHVCVRGLSRKPPLLHHLQIGFES